MVSLSPPNGSEATGTLRCAIHHAVISLRNNNDAEIQSCFFNPPATNYNMQRIIQLFIISCLFAFFSSAAAIAADVTGAGSSAAAPLYKKWAEHYETKNSVSIDYQPLGSSTGIKQIKAKTVDFGASDVALSAEDLKSHQLIEFPSAISGVVPIVNVPGIKSGEIKLTGEILAAIFSRRIQQWNDAEIAAINPGLRLPEKAIEVLVRSDGSGTTYNFTDYLGKLSADWKSAYGKNFTIAWHKDLTQVKGSSSVVASLKKTPYSISYVDYNYVIQDKLDVVQLKNRSGKFVLPGASSFLAALDASAWKSSGNFEEMLTDKSGSHTWPITMGTFVVMQKIAVDPKKASMVLKFFTWAFMSGDHLVHSVDLVRLPDQVQARAFREMTTISDTKGNPLKWDKW